MSASVSEFRGMWDWALHKNGIIGFSVDHSTGGKTSGDITATHSSKTLRFLPAQVLFRPFGH